MDNLGAISVAFNRSGTTDMKPAVLCIGPTRPMRYATDTKYSMYNVCITSISNVPTTFRRVVLVGIHSKNLPRNFSHAFIRGSTDYCIGSVSAMCNVGVPYRSVTHNQPRWLSGKSVPCGRVVRVSGSYNHTSLGRNSQYLWRVPKGKVSSTTASRDRVAVTKHRATLKPCRARVIT